MTSVVRKSILAAFLSLGIAGSAAAADCVDTSPAVAQEAIEDAKRAVLTMEYGPTLAKLEEVRKSLPCLTGTLPTETLAKLFFYQGLFLLNSGNQDGSKEAFRDAAAVLPLLQEDREHDSKVRESWAAAREEVTKSTGTLVVPNLPKDAIAYVNGTPLQSGASSSIVYPGAHLLQVWGDDRKLHGTIMRVRSGETSLVPAEFITSLTPRGELVLDIQPRGSHVTIRQGNQVIYDFKKAPRRQVLSDVKQGAFIVEVSKAGFYPFSRGKVAVEGEDQTPVVVSLQRRPTISLFVRGGGFWVSSVPSDVDPVVALELVGRTSNGWGLHIEYLHHLQDGFDANGDSLDSDGDGPTTAEYEVNEHYDPDAPDGEYLSGPPAFPRITTANLPLNAQFYIGFSRQFRIEGVDVAVGPKLAMDLYRGSLMGEFSIGYDFVPWVGINLRAGLGAMIHGSKYLDENIPEEYDLWDYVRVGLVGQVNGGLRVGF